MDLDFGVLECRSSWVDGVFGGLESRSIRVDGVFFCSLAEWNQFVGSRFSCF